MNARRKGIESGYFATLYYNYFSNCSEFIHISLGTHNGFNLKKDDIFLLIFKKCWGQSYNLSLTT